MYFQRFQKYISGTLLAGVVQWLLRDLEKPFIPFHWVQKMSAAGLTPAEQLVVFFAGTRLYFDESDARWKVPWSGVYVAELTGLDRRLSHRAKQKLVAAGLCFMDSAAARALRRPEVWDFTGLVVVEEVGT